MSMNKHIPADLQPFLPDDGCWRYLIAGQSLQYGMNEHMKGMSDILHDEFRVGPIPADVVSHSCTEAVFCSRLIMWFLYDYPSRRHTRTSTYSSLNMNIITISNKYILISAISLVSQTI